MSLLADQITDILPLITTALQEDLRYGPDITTHATVDPQAMTDAALVCRTGGVIAGLDVALLVLDQVIGPDQYQIHQRCYDGDRVLANTTILSLHAPTQGLLTAERTMLNFVCHLSGIATTTAAWVDAVRGTHTKIRDTRKTLPGLRVLQKYAVRMGGGTNHRMGLGDAALIKDNHIAAAGSVSAALQAVRQLNPEIDCEVEVDSLEQFNELLDNPPELVLLDNFPVWQTQIAVQRRNHAAPTMLLESSGGISLDRAADYAATGVDFLALGALTHSAQALDIGLDL